MATRLPLAFGLFLALIPGNALAQGGPPLVTDDPGTPGAGNWEINLAMQWSFSDPSTTLQLPALDLNYGYGDHIQLNLNTSWILLSPSDAPRTSGLSVASAGVKWRFVDEDSAGVAVSTYPRIDFHHGLASEDPAVNTPGSRYFLPVELSKEFGQVGVNPEVGYAAYTQFPPEWVYGLALAYSFAKEREALFEIHGRSVVGSSDRELLFNFGTRYAIAESASLLATAGRTFRAYADAVPSLNFYLGVQLRL